jgi:hypothetical protein
VLILLFPETGPEAAKRLFSDLNLPFFVEIFGAADVVRRGLAYIELALLLHVWE